MRMLPGGLRTVVAERALWAAPAGPRLLRENAGRAAAFCRGLVGPILSVATPATAPGCADEHRSVGVDSRALRRRLSRRALLVRQRTRLKNEVHATVCRNLKGAAPVSDSFGAAGRRWLEELELPADERKTVAGCPCELALAAARHRRSNPFFGPGTLG